MLFRFTLMCRIILLIITTGASIVTMAGEPAGASVTGIVQNEDGQILSGASVTLKNAKSKYLASSLSDEKGVFRFSNVPLGSGYVFTISYIGYETAVIPGYRFNEGEKIAVVIKLKTAGGDLDKVVVIGYGSQSRSKVTGAVSQLNSSAFKNMPVSRIDQAMAGQMAGIQVAQFNGAPGAGVSVKVRGLGSVTAGNQPLYVIDGFPVERANLNTLNTSDIASINVLKDAAAAAIYGSRGSNGVVLITTKKGDVSKPHFTFDSYYGTQSVVKKIPMMDAYEYAHFVADARNNWWVDQKAGNVATDPNSVRSNVVGKIPEFLQPYLDGKEGLVNTDWQDAIFRNAVQQNYSFSVSGGTDNSRYYVSGNYFDQDGVVINTGFKRYSLRANLESKLSRSVTFGINLNPSYTSQKNVNQDGHSSDGVITTALIAMPNFPVYNADGSYALGNQAIEASKYSMAVLENPVAVANLIDNNTKNFRMLSSAYLDIRLLKALKFKTYVGADYTAGTDDYFRPSVLGIYRVAPPSKATGKSSTSNILNWISENTLNYAPVLTGGHNLSLLAGYSLQKETNKGNSISGTNYPNDQVHSISAATTLSAGTAPVQEWSLMSYVGRATYDYQDKYFLSASLRRDGSSRFGINNRWGWFPSASAGWRISKESFFPSVAWVDDVKLRVSYGQTGNFQIPNYGSYATLSARNYVLNGVLVNGQAPSTAPNPDLSWEKTGQVNIGADVSILKNHLSIAVDYYISRTNDLLLDVPVPYISSYKTMLRNVGSVENKGFEFLLNAKADLGRVKWSGSFNISTNVNKVRELGPGQSQIIATRNITQIGKPIGSFYGYNTIGVFKSEEEIAKYPHLSTSHAGSYIYEDVNPDGVINSNDRKIIGSPFPDYIAGLSSEFMYKGFDLQFLVNTVQGFEITQTLKTTYLVSTEGWANTSKDMFDNRFISAANTGNGYARARVQPTDTYDRTSSLSVEDGSFVRVRNLTLGYTFNQSVLRRMSVETLRLYISAQNPFTFTKYKGYNPETSQNGTDALEPGIDAGAYPAARSVVVGLNLNF